MNTENNKEFITLSGMVIEIIYSNEDNGYTICEISNKKEGQITLVGYMPYISEGENIEVFGRWVNHPEYGEQFSVKSYTTILPTEASAILQYLSSGIIPGIREATAKKIVDRFGTDTFNIMLNYPEQLSEISGISPRRAQKLGEEFQKQQSMSGIVMFLQKFNISARIAANVHKILGIDAVEKIKENPYILSDNVNNITFKTADGIAASLGISKNSPYRIGSYAKYCLTNAAYMLGHTYLPKDALLKNITEQLNVSLEDAQNALSDLCFHKDIMVDTIDGVSVYYLTNLLTEEFYIARRIMTLSNQDVKVGMEKDDILKAINEIAACEGIVLAKEQQDAVLLSALNGCVIITGGPGTGKTTTINVIIKLMKSLNLKVALAAPTGRAAKRMSEVTGLEAKTIHRLLGVVKNDSDFYTVFSKNEENPISEDVIIVDEVSMLDINLMSALLKAVRPGSKVIMVGDADQLPSVGPGNLLNDLILSKEVPVIKLENIFRQAQESMIVVNAHRINKGELPQFKNADSDFFFISRPDSISIAKTILELYKTRLPLKYNINPVNSIQVLSPSKKSNAGVINLNNLIQNEINPPDFTKNECVREKVVFRVNDKVMQNKNNYDIPWIRDNGEEGMGIFNGDIGIINKISTVDKTLEIVFDEDKHVEYSFNNIDELELSYAVTVHKSQGNEFDFVIIPICNFPPMLMYRNLLYTAITRAKQMVILVGNEESLKRMIDNFDKVKRYSGLLQRFKQIREISLQ